MTMPPGTETTFVKMIHPDTGGIAEVPDTGLQNAYAAGWVLLTEENAPPPATAPADPAPMTEAQVADRLAKAGGHRATGKPSTSKPSE